MFDKLFYSMVLFNFAYGTYLVFEQKDGTFLVLLSVNLYCLYKYLKK